MDFKRVAADALQRAEAVLRHWLPNGKRQGHERVSVNPTRADAKSGSFAVNMVTGAWSDFATGDKGGDYVALVKYLDGSTDMLTAARTLAAFCGSSAAPTPSTSRPSLPSLPAVLPVPADAQKPQRHPSHGKPSAVWTYRNAAGGVLFHVCRFDTPTGKQVLPLTLRRDPAGHLVWKWKGLDAPRPLYRLYELAGPGPVLICEGEKAADAAARLLPGFIASTSPNGSGGAGAADWSSLAHRRVVIWPDADSPGKRYAGDVKRLVLQAGATSVRVAELAPLAALRGAELPAGFDAADAEAEGLAATGLADWLAPLAGIDAAAALAPATAPAGPLPDSSGDGSGSDDPPPWLDDGEGDDDSDGEPEPTTDITLRREPGFFTSNGSDGRPAGVWFQPAAVQVGGKWKEAPAQLVCGLIEAKCQARTKDGDDWATMFTFTTEDGTRQSVMIRAALFARASGEKVFEPLMSRGWSVEPNATARQRAYEYLLKLRKGTPFARLVYCCGWHDGCYVAGSELIIGKPAEPLVLAPEIAPLNSKLAQAGTLTGWKLGVCRPLAGFSRLVLVVSAAFSALALGRLQDQGFGLHLVGVTSKGKSTAQAIAASVFGKPDKTGYIRSWESTGNAIEAVAAEHSDSLLVLDDLQQLQPKDAATVALKLANGSGKARLRDDSSLRKGKTWRTVFLSSGELGLAEHAASAGMKSYGGQDVRCIEVHIPNVPLGIFAFEPDLVKDGDSGALAMQLEAAAKAHHGHAWRPIVEALATDPEHTRWLRQRWAEYTERLRGSERDGSVHRVASYLALIAAAGDFATERLFLTGWPTGEAYRAADAFFRDWLQRRGGGGSAEARDMVAAVQGFISLHREGRFTDLRRANDDHRPKTLSEAGFRYYSNDADPPEYWIASSVFRTEVCKGFRWQDVAAELLRRGLLKPEADGSDGKAPRFDRSERVPGVGRCRVLRILPGILDVVP